MNAPQLQQPSDKPPRPRLGRRLTILRAVVVAFLAALLVVVVLLVALGV